MTKKIDLLARIHELAGAAVAIKKPADARRAFWSLYPTFVQLLGEAGDVRMQGEADLLEVILGLVAATATSDSANYTSMLDPAVLDEYRFVVLPTELAVHRAAAMRGRLGSKAATVAKVLASTSQTKSVGVWWRLVSETLNKLETR